MWPLVTYSNYLEIVFTVTFLVSQTGLIRGKFKGKLVFNECLLYTVFYFILIRTTKLIMI